MDSISIKLTSRPSPYIMLEAECFSSLQAPKKVPRIVHDRISHPLWGFSRFAHEFVRSICCGICYGYFSAFGHFTARLAPAAATPRELQTQFQLTAGATNGNGTRVTTSTNIHRRRRGEGGWQMINTTSNISKSFS